MDTVAFWVIIIVAICLVSVVLTFIVGRGFNDAYNLRGGNRALGYLFSFFAWPFAAIAWGIKAIVNAQEREGVRMNPSTPTKPTPSKCPSTGKKRVVSFVPDLKPVGLPNLVKGGRKGTSGTPQKFDYVKQYTPQKKKTHRLLNRGNLTPTQQGHLAKQAVLRSVADKLHGNDSGHSYYTNRLLSRVPSDMQYGVEERTG